MVTARRSARDSERLGCRSAASSLSSPCHSGQTNCCTAMVRPASTSATLRCAPPTSSPAVMVMLDSARSQLRCEAVYTPARDGREDHADHSRYRRPVWRGGSRRARRPSELSGRSRRRWLQSADPVDVARGYQRLYPFQILYIADLDGIEGRGDELRRASAGSGGLRTAKSGSMMERGSAECAAADASAMCSGRNRLPRRPPEGREASA